MEAAFPLREIISGIRTLQFEEIASEMDPLLPIISALDQLLVFVVGCTLLGYLIVGMLLILSWLFRKANSQIN